MWWLSVAVLAALFLHSQTFNIDVNIPVLRQGDQPGSYFGFSVAEHQFLDRRSGGNANWILVGAPKANTTNLLVNHKIVSPGAVYKCDLKNADCEQVDFLTENEENSQGEDIEDQSNMWFGVSLSTGPDGAVLACGHRYIYKTKRVNYHMYPGKCYTGRQNLIQRFIRPYSECLDRNKVDANSGSIATYERYQYCQMGVSSTYIPKTKQAMFGGPGTTNYQGMIFYGTDKDAQYKVGEIGYQGYSVAYGSFFSKTESDLVTGAPRHNHHGMVVVFSQDDDYKTTKVILPPKGKSQRQPGSGFGSSVAGIDVNNDGWSDILVGAPFYYVKGSVNEGRVFVYMNKGNGEFEKTLELAPSVSKNMARFGHVISRVGDLDQDGYEDVAIGAPYEDNTGVVYVFNGSSDGLMKTPAQIIKPSDLKENMTSFGYSISGDTDLDENGYPDLVIGAFESDKVALLRSRPIIEMVANTTINPKPLDIRSTNCDIKYQGKDIKTACMSLKICLGYKERKNKLTRKLSANIQIESDVEYNKKARVLFNSTSGSVYNKTLTELPPFPSEECFVEYVFLRTKVEDIYPDITFRIFYKMHQPSTPPTAAPQQLPPIADYAMLEEQKKTFTNAILPFQRDCVKCVPNLKLQQTSPKTLAVGGVDFPLEITVSNDGESAYRSELHITIPEGVSVKSVLDATDTSKKAFPISHKVTSKTVEDDNTTRIFTVPIANPLKNKEKKRFSVRLSTGGFSKSEDFLPINLKVSSANPEPEKHMADNIIKLNVSIISKADLALTGVRGKGQEQVLYGGQVVGESAMVTEDDIGNEVTHVYKVENLGPDLVPEAEIVIQWPYEAKSGKHLLYLMDVLVTGKGKCDFLPDQINMLNLRKKPKSQAVSSQNNTIVAAQDLEGGILSRKRRETEQLQEKEKKEKRQTSEPVKQGGRANIILDCQSKEKTARCTPIRCTMKKLKKGDVVKFTVRSRLWNGTFLEDYYGEYAKVISRASVKSLVTFVQEQDPKNNNALVSTQINPGFTSKRKTELAPWVIPVAVVSAIIVLALIIVLLWKCGFFRRKKFDGNITDAEREEMMQDSKKEKQPFET